MPKGQASFRAEPGNNLHLPEIHKIIARNATDADLAEARLRVGTLTQERSPIAPDRVRAPLLTYRVKDVYRDDLKRLVQVLVLAEEKQP